MTQPAERPKEAPAGPKKDGEKDKATQGKAVPVELSEDDVTLRDNLELLVARAAEDGAPGSQEAGLAQAALEGLRKEIRSATRHRPPRPAHCLPGAVLARRCPAPDGRARCRQADSCRDAPLRAAPRSSMTSVPKPLKFLRPHFGTLKDTFEKCTVPDNKRLLADILSLLAMTRSTQAGEVPESLKYRLLGSKEEIGCWGHEARAQKQP